MKYYADFRTGNGTCLINPLQGTNKKKLFKAIKEICISNTSWGDRARCYVFHREGNLPVCDYYAISKPYRALRRVKDAEGEFLY